jgi:hypothetical protein
MIESESSLNLNIRIGGVEQEEELFGAVLKKRSVSSSESFVETIESESENCEE